MYSARTILLALAEVLAAFALFLGLLKTYLDYSSIKLNTTQYILAGICLLLLATILGFNKFHFTGPKINQARRLVANEILNNISNMDIRLGLVQQALSHDEFRENLRSVREKVAPMLEQVAESGYHRLITEQKIASLRQAFNQNRISSEFGGQLTPTLMESGADIGAINSFYKSLDEVKSTSERLLEAMSDSASESVPMPEIIDFHNRHIDLEWENLINKSFCAHINGLYVLNELKLKDADVVSRISGLSYLGPRSLIDKAQHKESISNYTSHYEKIILKKAELVKEKKRLRDEALDRYSRLNDMLRINPTDTWNEVVGKAISLRHLGRTADAVAAFSRYGEMFSATDKTAKNYVHIAQQFTLQMRDIGLEGGVYLYALSDDGPAKMVGLEIGDIVITYGDRTIRNMEEITTALHDVPYNDPVKITYLRMNDAGCFLNRIAIVTGKPLGAGFMAI